MGSGFLVDASSGVLGKEDWALAVAGGRVRGTGSSSIVVMVVVCWGRIWRRQKSYKEASKKAWSLSLALPIAV